ncbi:hypothetical protein SLEP1_g57435 [Rubroshorea leprosula]|uniref:Uncharacterized protein n=1 Tax=Rubroshorea leprosula TaxID=152421 RepID=A0AAV5MQ90_9ROSI|nr:hypothetical protein SLEP1_g57435 [Rubroshorea leprosula]
MASKRILKELKDLKKMAIVDAGEGGSKWCELDLLRTWVLFDLFPPNSLEEETEGSKWILSKLKKKLRKRELIEARDSTALGFKGNQTDGERQRTDGERQSGDGDTGDGRDL